MTRSTNARIAGAAYLLYIAAAYPGYRLFSSATRGDTIAERLTNLSRHEGMVRLSEVLGFIGCLCALALAVSLYAVTRDEDRDIALIGFACRVAEGIMGAVGIPATLALVWLASGTNAPDAGALQTIGAWSFKRSSLVGATFFAVGSTAFCFLLLRGRMIPRWLAWLGFLGSAILIVGLFSQLGGILGGPVAVYMWAPVAVFEVTVAVWFILKGVPTVRTAA